MSSVEGCGHYNCSMKSLTGTLMESIRKQNPHADLLKQGTTSKTTHTLHSYTSSRDFVILITKSRNNVRKASVLAAEIMRYLREGEAEMRSRMPFLCTIF